MRACVRARSGKTHVCVLAPYNIISSCAAVDLKISAMHAMADFTLRRRSPLPPPTILWSNFSLCVGAFMCVCVCVHCTVIWVDRQRKKGAP